MNKTGIEWCDYSASLLKYRDATGKTVWHCEKTSPGCRSCYAEAIAERFNRGGPFLPTVTPTVTPFFDEAEAKKLLRSKKLAGKRVFIDDMSDCFGSWVPDEIIDRHFAVFALRPDVTFQVLTKRPERMAEYVAGRERAGQAGAIELAARSLGWTTEFEGRSLYRWPLPNVWLGTSVEDQRRADERIPHLLRVPAAVRFLSVEPLLGPIEFSNVSRRSDAVKQLGKQALDGISWVIVGGESGTGARPMQIEWARSLVKQCEPVDVACFVKQLGSNPDCGHNNGLNQSAISRILGSDARCRCGFRIPKDKKGGDIAEFPADLRVRQFPEVQPCR